MEAARAKKTKLMSSQKEEDEKLQNMADWSPGDDTSTSGEPVMNREERVWQFT